MISNEDVQLSKMSYTSKDFASIYPDLLDLTKLLTNKWDPSLSNESDPGVVLLKNGAFIADHNNYNIDKNILEAFLPSATQDRSVRNIVEMNGYSPKYYISANSDITLTYSVSEEDFTSFSIPAFTMVITNEDGDVTYTQVEKLSVDERNIPYTCRFMEGTINTLKVNNLPVIKLENLDENNRIYFPHKYIAENGVFIKRYDINEEFWEKKDYLLTQARGSNIYKVSYDSLTGYPYVEFPSDISSLIGNGLSISYMSSTGEAGNVKAKTLTVLSSSSSVEISDTLTVDMTNFTISNSSSITNGKNPETIDQMYNAFKKIVGTFDTLVTRKDYSNAVYNLTKDDNTTKIVSNDYVTDFTNDFNRTFSIITFDEYGTYFKQASTCNTNFKYKLHVTEPTKPDEGDIAPKDGKMQVYSKTSGWKELNTIDYNTFMQAAEAMSMNDLYMYALSAFNMSIYSDNRPWLALANSFIPASNDQNKLALSGINDLKCITHNVKAPEDGDIICIKNYVPLRITIVPYSKVTKDEKKDIINNIYKALSNSFNAEKVDFGSELSYDDVLNCLLNADDRIKNIILEDFDNYPYALIKDKSVEAGYKELPLYGDITKTSTSGLILKTIIAKNVLAGRACLLNFDENFSYTYGLMDTNITNLVVAITTLAVIPLIAQTSRLDISDVTSYISFDSVPENKLTINIDNLTLDFSIQPNSDKMLTSDDLILHIIYGSNDSLYKNYGDTTYGLRNLTSSTITVKKIGGVVVNKGDISIVMNTNVTTTTSGYDLQYDVKENEYIHIAYPNYSSDVTFPVYNYYHWEGENLIPANTDYLIKSGQYIVFSYTKNGERQKTYYGPGNVIRSNFIISKTTTGEKREWEDDQGGIRLDLFVSINSGLQIAHRDLLQTILNSNKQYCYWIVNHSDNLLFEGTKTDRILGSGEYFMYTNANKDMLVILGAGTKLTRSTNDTSSWVAKKISIESISESGLGAGIEWVAKDFSNNNFAITEMALVTLGEGDQIRINGWDVGKPTQLDNEWKHCNGSIIYTSSDGTTHTLNEIASGYEIRSRYDLASNSINGLKLSDNQTITLYKKDGSTPSTIEGGEDLYFMTSAAVYAYGDTSIDVSLYSEDKKGISLMSYKQPEANKPKDFKDGTTLELIDGRYTTIAQSGTATFPLSYTEHELILPIYAQYVKGTGTITVKVACLRYDELQKKYVHYKYCSVWDYGYNQSEAGGTFNITKDGMYLIRFTPLKKSDSSEELLKDYLLELTSDIISPEDNTIALAIYNPVKFNGLNPGLTSIGFGEEEIRDAMKDLIKNSTQKDVKPYFINKPEQSIALLKDDFSNADIYWDINNVVNHMTIAQIDLLNITEKADIDIIKSMRGYT